MTMIHPIFTVKGKQSGSQKDKQSHKVSILLRGQPTAHIIVRTKFLQQHPDIVKRWLAAHVELTQRINADPANARTLLNAEIERLTGQPLPQVVLDDAWGRITVTYDPIQPSLFGSATSAFDLGFLGDTKPDLSEIYDLSLLNEVLCFLPC